MKRFTCTQDTRSERTTKRSKKHSHGSKEDHCSQSKITCDYCHEDITHTARILCAVCVEFDLCIECFSAGVELRGHKYWHSYRVIEDLRFCFLTPDWSANEEQLLLEGLELYGVGNWFDVANYVSTKDVHECVEHYQQFYLSSPSWPEANFDDVVDSRLEASKPGKRSKCINPRRQRRAAKQASPKKKQEPAPSAVMNLSGYMPKRGEFEVEWDNACEKKIMDLEFTDHDTEIEIEVKLQLLESYNKRLAKRHSVRKFVVEKQLHDIQFQAQLKKSRTASEEKLHSEMKRFLRVMSVEEYNEFIKGLVKQQELEEKVRELQELRSKGFTSFEETQTKPAQKESPKMPRVKKSPSPTRTLSHSSSIPRSPTASIAAPVVAPVAPYPLRSFEKVRPSHEERLTRSRASLRKQDEQKYEQYQLMAYESSSVFLHGADSVFAVSVI